MEKNIPQQDAEEAVKKYYSSKYNESVKSPVVVSPTNSFRRYRSKINRKGIPKKFLESDTTLEKNSKPDKSKKRKKRKSKKTGKKSKSKSKSKK
jgi:hypothetical protein